MNLALNNLQRLICHKTQPTKKLYGFIYLKMVIIIVIGALKMIAEGLVKGLEELKIRTSRDLNRSIVNIGQNTEKSPGDLQSLRLQ